MGTAKTAPTIPLRNRPSFASMARLEIGLLLVILPSPAPWKNLRTAGLGIVAVDSKAMPRRRKHLALTWVGLRHRRASPAHPIRAGPQSRWFEVLDHSREQGMSHLQSSWLCCLRGHPLRDRKSSRFDMHRRHVADRLKPVLHKAAESFRREQRTSPRTEFLAPARRSACR